MKGVETPERAALTVTVEDPSLTPGAPPTVRNAMMSLPVEQQQVLLDEHEARRINLRRWLFGQMKRGVHYGDVPGVRKSACVDNWQSRPSLYKAGAELLGDLQGLRAEFTPEHIPGGFGDGKLLFCFCCRLYDTSGALVGEGRGAMGDGEKKMSGNSAIKMAQKRSHVDAIITTLGVSDLFTQDYGPKDGDVETITEAQAEELTKLCDQVDEGKTGVHEYETYRSLINARGVERMSDLPARFYDWAAAGLAKKLAAKGGDS